MITMKDIAYEAGVSRPTVSVILNGRENVIGISLETKERVLKAAEKLGYRRNEIARSMITGRSNFIGYLTSGLMREYVTMPLQGIVERAEKEKYFVKVFFRKETDSFSDVIKKIMEQRPAGLICRSIREEDYKLLDKECRALNIPYVLIGSGFRRDSGIRIETDDVAGAETIVEHLIGLGHKQIAFFCGNRGSGYVELRFRGFMNVMKKYGLPISEDHMIFNDVNSEMETAAVRLFSSGKTLPTAIFCGGDHFAMITLRAARRCGLKVPEDISVAGYANMEMCRFADPPLTTVAEPFEEVGELACELLIQEVKRKKMISFQKEIYLDVPVKLIIRESTAKAKG